MRKKWLIEKAEFRVEFFLFYGVAEVIVEIRKDIHREIANLKKSLIIVIRILGRKCEKYYGLEA